MNSVAPVHKERLLSFVERIEKLEEERAAIAEDVRQVYAEAKADGYDVKAMRQVVRLRKKDPATRQEEESMLDLYKGVLGME